MLLISVLVTIFMTILKAYLWLLKQMFKLIWNVYKLFLCLFPAAGIVLAALVVFECAGYFSGNDYIGQASDFIKEYVHASTITDSLTSGIQENIENGVSDISERVTQTLLESVTKWWEGILEQSEQKAYTIIAWAITILIGIPIFLGILLVSAAASGLDFVGIAIVCDLVLYVVRSILGMSTPFKQFRRRYCFFFHTKPFYDPKYEDSYQEWLKRHHDEFENDTFGTGKAVNGDYDPEDDYDRMGYREYEGRRVSKKEAARLNRIKKRQQNYDDYYEDYYDRLEEGNSGSYDNDRYKDNDRYEDYYEDDDHYEDDYYEDYDYYDDNDEYEDGFDKEDDKERYYRKQKTENRKSQSTSYSSFDFFAGCKSRDGVVKKYHSLAKLYHPDNFEGDSSAITEINRQYKEAIGRYK